MPAAFASHVTSCCLPPSSHENDPPTAAEARALMRVSTPIAALLFLPGPELPPIHVNNIGYRRTMDYNSGRDAVSCCEITHSQCRVCATTYSLGKKEANNITTVDADGLLSGRVPLFQLSTHKIFHVACMRKIYWLMADSRLSASAAAHAYNVESAQTPYQSVFRAVSPLMCRELQKDQLVASLNNAGSEGVSATMTADDAQKLFLVWVAVVRASRFGEETFSFHNANVGDRLGKYRGLLYFLARHFEGHGMFGVRDHVCTDCCFAASQGNFVTNCVVDGVTATCPVCGAGACGGELANMRRDRFCPDHDHLHSICGVMESPGDKSPCGRPISTRIIDWKGPESPSREAEEGESVECLKRRVSCDLHEGQERMWRRDKTLSEEYTAQNRLRKANSRRLKDHARLDDPSSSDHCRSGGSGTEHADCKGAWAVASEGSGKELQTVGQYRVNFKRHYAYVYVVLMLPCGRTLHSKFFPRAESPAEWIKLMKEAFPEVKDMPGIAWFDAACRVAPSIFLESGKHHRHYEHFKNTAILVCPIHQRSHKDSDKFCTEFCNANSYEVTFARKRGERLYKVNGTVCEEEFSWLGGFEPSVRNMKKLYADVFYKAVLDERNAGVHAAREATGKRVHDEKGVRVKDKASSNLSLRVSKFQ